MPILVKKVDHFFCTPVVVLQKVERKIIIVNTEHTLDCGQFSEDILKEFLIFDEFFLELFHRTSLFIESKFTGTTCI